MNVSSNLVPVSLETAKNINRHLPATERWNDTDLEEKVYQWFDGLDLCSLSVIKEVFPGKETLQEILKILNDGKERGITRGQLVASITAEIMPTEIRDLLVQVSSEKPQ